MFASVHNQYNFVGGEVEADWEGRLFLLLSLRSEANGTGVLVLRET